MIICPNCKKSNNDNSVKCCYCGETLPVAKKSAKNSKRSSGVQLSVPKKKATKSNSEKISNLAIIVVVIGIIFGIIAGLLYRIPQTNNSLMSFNWLLFVSAVVCSICIAIILIALSYVTKAIEEK